MFKSWWCVYNNIDAICQWARFVPNRCEQAKTRPAIPDRDMRERRAGEMTTTESMVDETPNIGSGQEQRYRGKFVSAPWLRKSLK